MQYFAWCINRPGVSEQRSAIIREHWDFIARYDDRLIARGPVLDDDDVSNVLGSIHIADLADEAEAKTFVHEEPFAKAGLFETIIVHRFDLELPRTQFEFESRSNSPRYFLYCPANPAAAPDAALKERHADYCQAVDAATICRGSLLTDHGGWDGGLYFLELEDRRAAENFLADNPYVTAELYDGVQIFRWTMGGPGNLNAAGTLD